MIRNYFVIVLRHLSRQRIFALINVLGLSLGIAISLLILLLVKHESSYDQFHPKADRIYRIVHHTSLAGNEVNTILLPFQTASWAKKNISEVEEVVRVLKGSHKLVSYDTIQLTASNFYYADPSFFSIFSFPFVSGSPEDALKEPYSIVISESMAHRYFGSLNPVGKELQLDNGWKLTVTGVFKDIPSNSHIHFDYMASFVGILDGWDAKTSWINNINSIYLLLREGASRIAAEKKLEYGIDQYVIPHFSTMLGINDEDFKQSQNYVRWNLQPLESIHLGPTFENEFEPNFPKLYIYIFSLLSVLILLIACINYMNLGTARSSVRAREISMRKVMGAHRSELIVQFLAETILLSFIALIIALALLELLVQPFNLITGKNLIAFDPDNLSYIPWLLLGTLILGILSGSWPAGFLSSFKVVKVLRTKGSEPGRGYSFRRGLVLGQFSVSIIFIICTLVVYEQVRFYQKKNPGFDRSHVIVLKRAYALSPKSEQIRKSLLLNPDITGVSFALNIPEQQKETMIFPFRKDSLHNSRVTYMQFSSVDQEYARALGLKMLAGSFFGQDTIPDEAQVVLNKSAIFEMDINDPIGKYIYLPVPSGKNEFEKLRIIGIMDDFHFESMKQEIRPLGLFLAGPKDHLQYLIVRFEPGASEKVLEQLNKVWNHYATGQPFEYFFLSQEIEKQYQEERMTAKLMSLFSLLSLFIAILGLLGLASFTADRRVREISIRKAMGATTYGIMLKLFREYSICILWAMVIAIPISLTGMHFWLARFPYHISIPWWIFIVAGISALITALITVIYHTVKSAQINPALSLRYE